MQDPETGRSEDPQAHEDIEKKIVGGRDFEEAMDAEAMVTTGRQEEPRASKATGIAGAPK